VDVVIVQKDLEVGLAYRRRFGYDNVLNVFDNSRPTSEKLQTLSQNSTNDLAGSVVGLVPHT